MAFADVLVVVRLLRRLCPLTLTYICRNVGCVSVEQEETTHMQIDYTHTHTDIHAHTHTTWPCTIDAYIVLENYYVVSIRDPHMCVPRIYVCVCECVRTRATPTASAYQRANT